MTIPNYLTPEMAVAFGVAAFISFLVIYAIGRLFSRAVTATPADATRPDVGTITKAGPSYTEIAAQNAGDFVVRGDEPVFTPAPDYANISMEIPANASYTQVAVATAAAVQRGLKPRLAGAQFGAAIQPAAVMSYAAIASQTVGEPRREPEGVQGAARVDYSQVDIDLSGLESYTAKAIAAARGQAQASKTLH